jgi:cytochrome P450
MNIHSVKKLLKKIYRKLKPIKPKTVDIKIDPAFELKTYLEQTDIRDLKKIEDYSFLQSNGPLHFFPKNNAWLVTGYDEITHVLKNHEIFSEVELYRIMGKTDALFDINNSEYENLRNLIRNYFSNSFFKLLEEQLRKNIKSLTENILKKDKVDFIKEFSHIVTSETIRFLELINH